MATVSKKQPHKKSSKKQPTWLRYAQLRTWILGGLAGVATVCYIVSAQLAAQAHESLAYSHFDQAQQKLELAQQWFPLVPRAQQLDEVSVLRQSAKDYADAISDFRADHWLAAKALFEKVSPEDLNYLNAQEYLHQSGTMADGETSLVANVQRINEAQSFADQHQYNQALTLLANIPPSDPNFEKAVELRQQVNEGLQHTVGSQPESTLKIRVPILMYHYISAPPIKTDAIRVDLSVLPDMFDKQIAYLADHNYHSVTMDDVTNALNGKGTLPPNPIVLTFDDGYKDFYQNAYPVLLKYRFKATVYVITDFTDHNPNYITWDQIRTMVASGLISAESHSLSHPDLTSLNDVQLQQQLNRSKAILEAETGKTVNGFCYPYGTYNPRVEQAVKQAGYTNATTTEPGTWHTQGSLLSLTRMRIKNYPMQDYFK